jgi:hypothetical protein
MIVLAYVGGKLILNMGVRNGFLRPTPTSNKMQTTVWRPVIRYGREVAVLGKQKLKKQSDEAHFNSILRASNIHDVSPKGIPAQSAADSAHKAQNRSRNRRGRAGCRSGQRTEFCSQRGACPTSVDADGVGSNYDTGYTEQNSTSQKFFPVLSADLSNLLQYIIFRHRCRVYHNRQFHMKVPVSNDIISQWMYDVKMNLFIGTFRINDRRLTIKSQAQKGKK